MSQELMVVLRAVVRADLGGAGAWYWRSEKLEDCAVEGRWRWIRGETTPLTREFPTNDLICDTTQ